MSSLCLEDIVVDSQSIIEKGGIDLMVLERFKATGTLDEQYNLRLSDGQKYACFKFPQKYNAQIRNNEIKKGTWLHVTRASFPVVQQKRIYILLEFSIIKEGRPSAIFTDPKRLDENDISKRVFSRQIEAVFSTDNKSKMSIKTLQPNETHWTLLVRCAQAKPIRQVTVRGKIEHVVDFCFFDESGDIHATAWGSEIAKKASESFQKDGVYILRSTRAGAIRPVPENKKRWKTSQNDYEICLEKGVEWMETDQQSEIVTKRTCNIPTENIRGLLSAKRTPYIELPRMQDHTMINVMGVICCIPCTPSYTNNNNVARQCFRMLNTTSYSVNGVAWRSAADKIAQLNIGTPVLFIGATTNLYNGALTVNIGENCRIIRLNEDPFYRGLLSKNVCCDTGNEEDTTADVRALVEWSETCGNITSIADLSENVSVVGWGSADMSSASEDIADTVSLHQIVLSWTEAYNKMDDTAPSLCTVFSHIIAVYPISANGAPITVTCSTCARPIQKPSIAYNNNGMILSCKTVGCSGSKKEPIYTYNFSVLLRDPEIPSGEQHNVDKWTILAHVRGSVGESLYGGKKAKNWSLSTDYNPENLLPEPYLQKMRVCLKIQNNRNSPDGFSAVVISFT